MKIFLPVILIFGICNSQLFAQHDPIYGIYNNNPIMVNPAYAGLYPHVSASLIYRSQWSGLEGHPTTAGFNVHSSFNQDKVGAGLTVRQDRIGITKNLEIGAAYAYKVQTGNGTLSLGLQAMVINLRHDYNELMIKDPDAVFNDGASYSNVNFGAGAIFTNDRVFAGISVPRMLGGKEQIGGQEITTNRRHVYGMAGINFHASHQLDFRPLVVFRQVSGAPLNLDIRADFIWNEKFLLGLISRGFNNVGATLGIFPDNRYNILYQFEMPIGNGGASGFNSHEITLGIRLTALNFHEVKYRPF